MKKILIVRSCNSPARVEKEARSLKEAGNLVNILYWDRSSNKSRIEINDGISIRYFGLKAPYGKVSLIPYLFLWWAYEFIFLLTNDYDIIHACCLDTIIPAVPIKIIKNKKIVYDIFDFYSETLPKSIPNPIVNLVSKIEIYCIGFADYVVIVDESRYVQIKEAKIKNYVVIMNCPSEMLISNKNMEKHEHFTVFYGGMISKTRGLTEIIDAIKEEQDITLIVAGMGEDEEFYKPIFHSVKNIISLGWISYQRYIELTAQADIIFGYYDPSIPNNKLASPNKLFEAMMCGTPIIINEETSMKNIVLNNRCGIIIPYKNVNLLHESILKLKNDLQIAREMGINGRKAYEREYNWKIMETRLLGIYSEI